MMNKGSWVALATFIIYLSACTNGGGNGSGSDVLADPPFKIITDSIHKFPSEAGLYLKRAEMLSQKDMHQLAGKDFEKAWKLHPDETTGLLFATNLFLSGKESQAIVLLKECQQKFPGQLEFTRRLSEAYLQTGQSRAALEQYDALIAEDSSNFEAWYEKGVIMAQQKDTAKAIAALSRAYSIQPLQTYGIMLANLYAETKNKKALEICDQLIERDTLQELTDALFIKGIYYGNTGHPDLALEQYESCIRRDWKFPEAYIEKGIILYNEHNIDEALKTFALAAKVSNTYPDAYYWMGRCFEIIGKKEEARDSYRRAIAFDRQFVEAREGLNRLK